MSEQLPLFVELPPANDFDRYWLVYEPEFDAWWPFPAELAAQYCLQGCLLLLADDAFDEKKISVQLPLGKSLSDYPSPNPDAPPFDERECVWYFHAARFSEFYSSKWNAIESWLHEQCGFDVPAKIKQWTQRYGKWAGLYDLDAAGFSTAPSPADEAIPF